MKEFVLKPGESCEDCIFFDMDNNNQCKKHQIKECGTKLFFAYKDSRKDKQSDNDYLEKNLPCIFW